MNRLETIPTDKLVTLLQLQRQIRSAEQEKELEQLQQDIIRKYSMVEGDYTVIITLYEGSELMPRADSFGPLQLNKQHCNAFVEIECNGECRKSKVRKQTNNPIFDERFYFSFRNLTQEELEAASIKFSVYDRSALLIKKSLMGMVELDWTNVYFRRNHEIYRGWLLLNETDQTEAVDQPLGYLLVNVAVLGPHDKQTVHDSKFVKDPLTTMEQTVTIKKARLLDYSIKVEVFRAEHLPPIDTINGQVKAYVVAKFSGGKIRTSKIRSSNPEWNELLKIGTKVPTRSKFLCLEVWASQAVSDDLIGVVRVPFSDIVDGKYKEPRWANLYGPPISGKDRQPLNYATKMQLFGDALGSHYRGRLLFNIEGLPDVYSKTSRQDITFKFPYRPIPSVPQKAYTLRSYVFEGFEIPGKDGSEVCVHILMGPYLLFSSKAKLIKGRCGWYQKLEDKRVVLPCVSESNIDQLPDVIVYLSSGDYESTRMSFVRVRATSILTTSQTPEVNTYELNEDKSLALLQSHECGGYLTMKVQLFSSSPPPALDPKKYESRTEQYDLRIYLYMAQGLPPANQMGDSDPFILFRCAGESVQSVVKRNTLNPCWYEIYFLKVTFEDILKSLSSKGIMCIVYDQQPNEKKNNFIGRFWVPIQPKKKMLFTSAGYRDIQILHQRPKWFHVRNQSASLGQHVLGRVLLGWSLIPSEHADRVPLPRNPVEYMRPSFERIRLRLYMIGIRSMAFDERIENLKAILSFSELNDGRGTATDVCKVKNSGCSFNALLDIEVELPDNPNLSAFMEIKLLSERHNGKQKFIGFASVQIHTLLPKSRHKLANQRTDKTVENTALQTINEESEKTLVDVDKLERDLQLLQKKKADEQRIAAQENFGVQASTLRKVALPSQFSGVKDLRSLQSTLESMFSQFEDDFKTLSDYDYVRKLEQERDIQQKRKNPVAQHIDLESEMRSNNESASLLSGGFGELEREHHFTNLPLDPHVDRRSEHSSKKSQSKRMQLLESDKVSEFSYESRLAKHKQEMQSVEAVRLDQEELSRRYTFKLDDLRIQPNEHISEAGEIDQRAIRYDDIERQYEVEQQHRKLAMEKQSNYKYSSAVKLTLFKWRQRTKKRRDQQTYQDFDTDPDENLDITPEWYKGRRILAGDYQDRHKPTSKLKEIDIFCGDEKKEGEDFRSRRKVASLKMVVLSEEEQLAAIEKYKHYSQILTPKFYICRLYFLKGKSLVSEHKERPTTYLRIIYGNEKTNLKEQTLCKESSNPEYYCSHDIVMELPGPSTVRIEVMEHHQIRKDRVLGYTDVDVESRYLTRHWHLLQRKPIELRNLYSDYGRGSQGRLEMWVDLIERKNWESMPPEKIHAPPYDEYELRVIVWGTKGCVFKDIAESCNDLFVRGYIGNQDPQDTDVHWRCRGQGSFNWRWKFKVNYPPKPEEMYSDILTVQIWDKDVVGYNDLIGECRINLNRIHRLVEKAVKRKRPTKAFMKIIEKGMDATDKFYFDVYNEKELDEFGNKVSQGKVQLSFELVPAAEAKDKLKNGYGRSQPNLHPTLPDPTGRMKFDCMHPRRFLKQILGSKLYKKIKRKAWCIVAVVVVGLLLYVLLGHILSRLIVPCKTN